MGLVSLVIGFYDISIARAHDNFTAGLGPDYIRENMGLCLDRTINDIRSTIEIDKI